MNSDKLLRRIQCFSTFLLGAAFSSVLSYGFGWGNWLYKVEPVWIAAVIVLVGVLFYRSTIKPVRRRG